MKVKLREEGRRKEEGGREEGGRRKRRRRKEEEKKEEVERTRKLSFVDNPKSTKVEMWEASYQS